MKRMRIDRSEVLRIQEKSKRIGREYKPSILHYYKERNKQGKKDKSWKCPKWTCQFLARLQMQRGITAQTADLK